MLYTERIYIKETPELYEQAMEGLRDKRRRVILSQMTDDEKEYALGEIDKAFQQDAYNKMVLAGQRDMKIYEANGNMEWFIQLSREKMGRKASEDYTMSWDMIGNEPDENDRYVFVVDVYDKSKNVTAFQIGIPSDDDDEGVFFPAHIFRDGQEYEWEDALIDEQVIKESFKKNRKTKQLADDYVRSVIETGI